MRGPGVGVGAGVKNLTGLGVGVGVGVKNLIGPGVGVGVKENLQLIHFSGGLNDGP